MIYLKQMAYINKLKESSESSAGSALQENAKYMESIEAKVNQAKQHSNNSH